jgi:hypothetical protein
MQIYNAKPISLTITLLLTTLRKFQWSKGLAIFSVPTWAGYTLVMKIDLHYPLSFLINKISIKLKIMSQNSSLNCYKGTVD